MVLKNKIKCVENHSGEPVVAPVAMYQQQALDVLEPEENRIFRDVTASEIYLHTY